MNSHFTSINFLLFYQWWDHLFLCIFQNTWLHFSFNPTSGFSVSPLDYAFRLFLESEHFFTLSLNQWPTSFCSVPILSHSNPSNSVKTCHLLNTFDYFQSSSIQWQSLYHDLSLSLLFLWPYLLLLSPLFFCSRHTSLQILSQTFQEWLASSLVFTAFCFFFLKSPFPKYLYDSFCHFLRSAQWGVP